MAQKDMVCQPRYGAVRCEAGARAGRAAQAAPVMFRDCKGMGPWKWQKVPGQCHLGWQRHPRASMFSVGDGDWGQSVSTRSTERRACEGLTADEGADVSDTASSKARALGLIVLSGAPALIVLWA